MRALRILACFLPIQLGKKSMLNKSSQEVRKSNGLMRNAALLLVLAQLCGWQLAHKSSQVHAQSSMPRLYIAAGRQFHSSFRGTPGAMQAMLGRSASPLAMATEDFDRDGINDLAVGFATPRGGLIAIHKGNLDAFAPQSRASHEGIGRSEFPAPYLPEA